ncbi:hypothetical protein [Chryseobacterium sp.]|uniref:hypothetical protein n=1 Tax=Chryseobacterium sp. TaxID=1871047 RepID=UPI001B16D98D|nr:hypothetical protein [Chryseobacterium sp.]MBO9691712.1 hypothetical protein [Chryseobacterium sp.]
MRKKIIHKILFISIFFILHNCYSVPETHYIPPLENEQPNGRSKLIIQLYDNEKYHSILIKTDKNEVLFEKYKINNSISTKKVENSKVLEFLLKDDVNYVILKYNGKRYKLTIDKTYNNMLLDIRLNKIELAYTNREPIY